MIIKLIALLMIILIFGYESTCNALSTEIHQHINEYISKNSFVGFSLDSYLKDNLGFSSGYEEIIDDQKIYKWIRDGGLKEDMPYWYMPYLRSVNHFHNPFTDQGFSGIWGTGFLAGESSIQWSQKPAGTQSPGGRYSWHDAREYFYTALTATDRASRDENLADTFRGVGQLMHLVQDVSVPEHARNDGHYFPAYEGWMQATDPGSMVPNVYILPDSGYIEINGTTFTPETLVFFDSALLGDDNPLAPVPVANLFDTNQYGESNPDPDVTLQGDTGLSEYTNANFLTPDTMFTGFPHPSLSDTYEFVDNSRTYIGKYGLSGGGSGESVSYLATTNWFYKYLPSDLKHLGLKMDKKVYSHYAKKLIPRAVGYSSQLLQYFFRGDIKALNVEILKDGSENVTGIKLKVLNNTPDESIGTGKLIVSYQYESGGIYNSGNSGEVSLNEVIDTGSTSSTDFIFNFGSSIPHNATDVKYWLVFRGQLGNEDDAVVPYYFDEGQFIIVFYDPGLSQMRYAYLSQRQIDREDLVETYDYPGYIAPFVVTNPSLFTVKAYMHRGQKIYMINHGTNIDGWIDPPPYSASQDPLGAVVLYDPAVREFFNFPFSTANFEYSISENYIYLFMPHGNSYGYKVVYYESGQGITEVIDVGDVYYTVDYLDANGLFYHMGSFNNEINPPWSHTWYPLLALDIWTGQTTETGLNWLDWYTSSPFVQVCPGNYRYDEHKININRFHYPVTRLGENLLSYSLVEFQKNTDKNNLCVSGCYANGYCSQYSITTIQDEDFLNYHFNSSIVAHETDTCIGRDIDFDRVKILDSPNMGPIILRYPFAIENINNAYVMFYEEVAAGFESGICHNAFFTSGSKTYIFHLKTPTEDLTYSVTDPASFYESQFIQSAGFILEDQYSQDQIRIHGAGVEFVIDGVPISLYSVYDINNNRIEQKITNCLGGIDFNNIIMIFPVR